MIIQFNLQVPNQDVLRMMLLLFGIIMPISIFFLGIIVTRWYAKKKEWDESLKPALIVNLIWFMFNLFLYLFITQSLLAPIIQIIINPGLGMFSVVYMYKREYKQSIIFATVIQIILIIATLILALIFGGISIIVIQAMFY